MPALLGAYRYTKNWTLKCCLKWLTLRTGATARRRPRVTRLARLLRPQRCGGALAAWRMGGALDTVVVIQGGCRVFFRICELSSFPVIFVSEHGVRRYHGRSSGLGMGMEATANGIVVLICSQDTCTA